MRRIALILGLLSFIVGTTQAETTLNILKGKATSPNKAALFLSVSDDAGRPIKGLSKEQFTLMVGGEEIRNVDFEPVSTTQEHLSIVLGIDVSGSMKGKPFDETKKAVSVFLDQLDKDDLVCLLSFGVEVKLLTEFSNKRHEIREKIESLKPVEAWTHLYDATYGAIEKGKKSPTTRTAIILVTDGKDEKSNRKREEAVNIVTGASIPVFTIGFGDQIDTQYLGEIASASGGSFLSTPEPQKISELYTKVLDQLKNQYKISFEFSKAAGIYKSTLILNYQNKTTESGREFLFNPDETPISLWKELISRMTWVVWIIVGSICVVIAVFVLLLLMKGKKRKEEDKRERKDELMKLLPIPDAKDKCYLEYPKESPTAFEFIDSKSGSKTRLATDVQDIFLKVDSLKGRVVPLVYKGGELIAQLIIARKPEEEGLFKKEESVYLWTDNEYVSGPKEGRPGHAMIYLTEQERFAVKDLGSKNGTLVKGTGIKDEILLRDGDEIDVGGRQGLRVVYRESELEPENE